MVEQEIVERGVGGLPQLDVPLVAVSLYHEVKRVSLAFVLPWPIDVDHCVPPSFVEPKHERSGKRRVNLNSLAASIVADATDEDTPTEPEDTRDPSAVALGRKSGLKGVRARADKLTAGQRSAIARRAAAAGGAVKSSESAGSATSVRSGSPGHTPPGVAAWLRP